MDNEIEALIEAKNLTGPRITAQHIAEVIEHEYYFTAQEGTDGAKVQSAHPTLKLLTLCVLVMRNGFTVLGHSACVSPERFDAQIGRKIARQKAIDQIWALEGYLLATTLSEAKV